MNDDTSLTGIDRTDMTDLSDRSLITDISEALKQVSGRSRAERQRQRIRDDLVREHLASEKLRPSGRSKLRRLFKLN
jgi:hypothetical protein